MKNQRFAINAAALAVAAVLAACSGNPTPSVAAAPPPPPATQAAAPQEKPGAIEGELIVMNATVKAIDKKNRVVTLKHPDGKITKVKCGPEVRNFQQIRVGDDVKAQFLESAEIFVTGADKPVAEHESEVKRAPLGSKPGVVAVDAVEVKATVQAIDYQSRDVTLQGPEGKVMKVKAGPEVKRLNEVKQGDTVVIRLTRAVSIQVSTPEKK